MTSPSRTRRLLRVTRFTLMRSLPHVSSVRMMQTVWRRFFPRSTTVSPRKSCNSSVLSWCGKQTLTSLDFFQREHFCIPVQYTYTAYIHPTIHLLPHYPELGRGVYSLGRNVQTSLAPISSSWLIQLGPKKFPGQPRDLVLPVCPGYSPGSPPGGTCLEHFLREVSRRHPKQIPESLQLARLDAEEQRLYSKFLPGS